MSDSVRPQRWQPTRLPRPWDSPGKNTGVGCHFLLQCMKVKSEREVLSHVWLLATPWTTLLHPWDFPGKSIGVGCHCLLQATLLYEGYCCCCILFFSHYSKKENKAQDRKVKQLAQSCTAFEVTLWQIYLSHVRIWTCVKFICLTIMLSYLRHAVLSPNILNTQCLNFCNNLH